MNPINEIIKDGTQFLREPRTLMLMVAAPLIVLFIMSAIFSGNSTLPKQVSIGICDLDGSNASALFVAGLSNNSAVHLYNATANCSAVLENDVQTGQQAAGLVIPAGFEQGIEAGSPQNISMFVDNSRLQVSSSIEIFIQAAVQETDQRIGAEFISSVWSQLGTADDQMAQTLLEINDTRERAMQMRINLQNTSDSFQSLNISGAQEQITAANQTIIAASAAMDDANANLTRIASNFANYSSSLAQDESDLLTIQSGLDDIQSNIAVAQAAGNCGSFNPSNSSNSSSANSSNSSASASNATNASNSSTPFSFAPYCLSINSLSSSVAVQQQAVATRIDGVHQAQAGLADANQTIIAFEQNIAAAQNGTADAQARIGLMNGFVNDLQASREQSLQTISDVDLSLQELINKTYDFQDQLTTSREQIQEITSRAPASVLSPISVDSTDLFGQRSFFQFMLPSLLPLILMFVALFLASTSLVREKNSGTLKRIFTAQVNPFEYAAVKVLSYSVVLLPEALLLALVASVGYGAFALTDFGAWFFVIEALTLLTVTFVSVGVLIAVYSESEATAFLASLVIGLPLLFMSGILFPIEFMPPPVALLSFASPLTQTVLSMQGAMIYHSLQAALSTVLILYDVVLVALIGLSLRKKP